MNAWPYGGAQFAPSERLCSHISSDSLLQTHLLFSFNTYTFTLSERCTLLVWDDIFSHFSWDLDQCFKQNNLIQGPHVTFICWIFVVDPYFSKRKEKKRKAWSDWNNLHIHKFGISLHLNRQRSNVSTSIWSTALTISVHGCTLFCLFAMLSVTSMDTAF